MDENLTSYCGLCCSDCIPSRRELFTLVEALGTMLAGLQFEQYAELKSDTIPEFRDYPSFLSVLHQIGTLRCTCPCRSGGGYNRCEIRDCATRRGLSGCWQCTKRPGCILLDRLRTVHPHLDYHLDLIRDMGPAAWFEKRREHYRWQLQADNRECRC